MLLNLGRGKGRMILENLLLEGLHWLHVLQVIIGERHSIIAKRHLVVVDLSRLLLLVVEPVLLAPVADLSE